MKRPNVGVASVSQEVCVGEIVVSQRQLDERAQIIESDPSEPAAVQKKALNAGGLRAVEPRRGPLLDNHDSLLEVIFVIIHWLSFGVLRQRPPLCDSLGGPVMAEILFYIPL